MWSGGKVRDSIKDLPITIKYYAKNDKDLEKAQKYAKINRLGLWRSSKPIAPWDYRRGKKK